MYKFLINPNIFNQFIIFFQNKYIIYFKNINTNIFIIFKYIVLQNIYYKFYYFKNSINLNIYIYSWFNFIVKKLKFKHKISWVYIYRKNLNFFKINTNLSHKCILIQDAVNVKRKKKHLTMHTITVWGVNFEINNFILNKIIKTMPLNKYTQRGFRLARCSFERRIGKVSKYSTLKSKVF